MINKIVNGNEENVAIDKTQLVAALSPRDVKINTLLNTTPQKAEKSDLTSVIATGSTNTTGATITNGAYFYLNGVFCRAIADIAANAAFTKNTNYVETSVKTELENRITYVRQPDYIAVNSDWYSIAALLYRILTNIDMSKVTAYSYIVYNDEYYHIAKKTVDSAEYSLVTKDASGHLKCTWFKLKLNENSAATSTSGGDFVDITTQKDGLDMYFYY